MPSKNTTKKSEADVKKNNRTGPKSKVDDPQTWQLAFELVGKLGARNQDLADFFDVDVSTIDYWLKNHEQFATAVRRARTHSSLKVSQSLYEKAIGCTITEQVVIQNTIKEYHENGKLKRQHTEPIIVEVQKQLPPDAYAAHKYLSIIFRDVWADVQKLNVDHHHSGEILHKKIEELSLDGLSEPIKNLLFNMNMKEISDAQEN